MRASTTRVLLLAGLALLAAKAFAKRDDDSDDADVDVPLGDDEIDTQDTFSESQTFDRTGPDDTFTEAEAFATDDARHPHHETGLKKQDDQKAIADAVADAIAEAEADADANEKQKATKKKKSTKKKATKKKPENKKPAPVAEDDDEEDDGKDLPPDVEPGPEPKPTPNAPPGYDPTKARELAPRLARHIIRARYDTDKRLVRTFQTYAGFPTHLQTGNYGNETWAALRYWVSKSSEPYQEVPRALFKPAAQPPTYNPPAGG